MFHTRPDKKKKDACRSKHPYTAEGPDGAMATAIIHIGKTIRSCLDFISALVERTFCVGFFSRAQQIVVYLQESREKRCQKGFQINRKAYP